MAEGMVKVTEEVGVEREVDVRIKSNMVLMLMGKMVSLFGTYLYNFAISLYILRETGSGMNFALVLICGLVPRLVLAPFAGAIADRLDRKKMVVGMDILSGIVVLGLWGVTEFLGLHVWYIYVTAVLLSITNTFFGVALDASIPNLVDNKRLVKVNSLNSGIASLTQITAPMAGGLVYGFVSIEMFLLVNALSFILSGISEMFIDFDLMAPKEEEVDVDRKKITFGKILGDMKEGFVFLRTKELLFTLFMFSIFINFFFNLGLAVPLPYIINNVIQLAPTQFGIIEGMISGGVLVASILLSVLPEFKKKYKVLSISMMYLTFCLIVIGVPAIPAVMALGKGKIFVFYICLGLSMGFVQMLLNMPVWVMMQRETPNQYRGRVFGLVQTIAGATAPLGFLLAGVLIELIPAYILPITAGILMIPLTGIIIRNKHLRQM